MTGAALTLIILAALLVLCVPLGIWLDRKIRAWLNGWFDRRYAEAIARLPVTAPVVLPELDEEHGLDWIGYVETDDEYAARCYCTYRVTAWRESAAEEQLNEHLDEMGVDHG